MRVCVQSRLMRLLQRLPASVVRRVHRERHAAPSWITLVPERQRLTDADLQEFTRSLIGAALLAMFRYCMWVALNLNNQPVYSGTREPQIGISVHVMQHICMNLAYLGLL